MAGDLTAAGGLYSPLTGMMFVFNLIVGTGALTMPNAFGSAGWMLSLIVVIMLAFTSYLTVTFMIETMASANAMRRWKRLEKLKEGILNAASSEFGAGSIQRRSSRDYYVSDGMLTTDEVNTGFSESSPLLGDAHSNRYGSSVGPGAERTPVHYYDISERIEMGQMAGMFFNKVGVVFFHICMAVYLYGDLAIYAAAVPESLRDVACTYKPIPIPINGSNGSTCNESLTNDDQCWHGSDISRMNAYRIFLAIFGVSLGSFVFFNVQKTIFLQIFTSFMRWFAFITMITLACIRLGSGQGQGRPPVVDFGGLPTLFGVCVYSFMCHHSLPSLATPMRDKSKLFWLFGGDYLLILGFYCLLSFTGIFAFKDLKPLYTLNFLEDPCDPSPPVTSVAFLQYLLALFPVFTLSTNFPIIGITLRNNLKSLMLSEDKVYHWTIDRLAFPFITLIPPLVVALITDKVDVLVGFTGSYAGAVIQYIIPAALVLLSRRQTEATINHPDIKNKHRSPFKHKFWVYAVFIWAVLCITFVTVNHILVAVKG